MKECRTPHLLVELAEKFPKICVNIANERTLLQYAMKGDISRLESFLKEEEINEKEKDREYWFPLRQELEKWRIELKF